MNIDLYSILALILFVLVGFLIPIHDHFKSTYSVLIDKKLLKPSYKKVYKFIYAMIIILCGVSTNMLMMHPIFKEVQLLDNQPFYNDMIVFLANFGIVMNLLLVGGFLGVKFEKSLQKQFVKIVILKNKTNI